MKARHLLEGRLGERIACRFLLHKGYDVLARRYVGSYGEIDIIALDHQVLVFVEVKTRASRQYGDPWEFVDWKKQKRFEYTADEFIDQYDLGSFSYRFDIVTVLAPGSARQEVAHYCNAF